MPAFQSRIDTASQQFLKNRSEMLAELATVRALEKVVRDLSNSQKTKFDKRQQLLPRTRLSMLLDRGAPVLEFSTLAGFGLHDDNGADQVLGGCVITGIGYVSGVRCVFNVSDSAIKGGSIPPKGMEKTLRAQTIALENKLPMINLIESGGANLAHQAELFLEGGRVFKNMSVLSAQGIPQITICHGSSTAGGAYIPGLSDYLIIVKDRGKIFLAGPPLLKAATGEIADDESLGGAIMHTEISGVAEYLAQDDADGIRIARELVSKLGWKAEPAVDAISSSNQPRYDPEELCGVVPTDYRVPYDAREVIARIVDDSDFLDFKETWGNDTVCGYAAIAGNHCGIIANNGPIDANGSAKAGQFVQLCCQSQIPLVFLQNTTGYMVGTQAERAGIVKHGAKMIQAVANADVPKITLHIGASFGAGNYGMCGRAFDPRFLFAWPNSRLAVMGGQQAAMVMRIIAEEKMKAEGKAIDEERIAITSKGIIERIDKESTALFATARLWDDGIIDPRDSRKVLASFLSLCNEARAKVLSGNSFGVARL
jgi:geranyl-CoA carboxylase beta subunit